MGGCREGGHITNERCQRGGKVIKGTLIQVPTDDGLRSADCLKVKNYCTKAMK
jgi:hypothetical protein